jgi:predicted O-methyltransferase YrrM
VFRRLRNNTRASTDAETTPDPLVAALAPEIHRLSRLKAPDARRLAAALRATTSDQKDPDLQRWSAAIEAERKRLRRSRDSLSGGRGTTSTVGKVTKRASVPPAQAALLFHLARSFNTSRCLEMGTCVGISGAYLAAALQTNGGGALRSLEGHRDRAEIARQTWSQLGFSDAEVVVGRFEQTLDDVLAGEPFDLVFIDGNHDHDATVAYAASFRAASRPGAVMVLDDIAWSDGMKQAWVEIRAGLVESVTADLGRLGLVVLRPRDAGGR